MALKVLIIGSGGREHALAWALARLPRVGQIYVAPGNGGTEWPAVTDRAASTNVDLAPDDLSALITFAQQEEIGLTVVGPEAPLADGLVDAFQAEGLPIFGPSQAAAQLEASKAFAKQFMARHNIPTAAYRSFDDYKAARAYLEEISEPVVVKASGLAAGKGVILCDNRFEAEVALRQIMVERAFGPAGDQVVIEERISGPELSVLAFCDGRTVVAMPPARDHKRVYDQDQGPNTGGMGAYAPVPGLEPALVEEIKRTVLQPAVDGLAAQGAPYVGVLYAGLMLTAEGPKVLEFNCRFGDPETQVILPLLAGDLAEIMLACIEGRLAEVDITWRPDSCATVVMASEGYPGPYPKGRPITGLDVDQNPLAQAEKVMVFHAGTARRDGRLVTAGGRVLAVSALGPDLEAALERAYAAVETIHFAGGHYRRDIGRPNS
jgi:phosphoribosylamine--glycine ligase